MHRRLFIALTGAVSALLCLLLGLAWLVPYIGFDNIHPGLSAVTGLVLAALLLGIVLIALSVAIQAGTGKKPFGSGLSKLARSISIRFFLPLMELLGRLCGLPVERVRRSFIQVNNELVAAEVGRFRPAEILILLPHCLQWSGCSLRVSSRPENCARCGRCDLAGLMELVDKYGVGIGVATGGTLARRIVKSKNPRLIIAVACERDLASGIQDTHPLPAYGVLNERPNGPCLDTRVAVPAIEKALQRFIA
jgi:hypothetical protein